MARSRYKITKKDAPHFLTFTINEWIPVFTRPDTVKFIIDTWKYLQQHRNLRIYAYVILENHIHIVAQSDDLSRDIKSFKAHTARVILDYLEQQNAHFLLSKLAFFKKKHKTQSKYQLWQEGSHPQLIIDEKMLRQKVEYIHMNPVKRGYVKQAEHWCHSSAGYFAGETLDIEIFTQW